MDKLTKLIEKRSTVRSSVTKLFNRVQSLGDEDINTVSELIDLIENKEDILKKQDLEIEDLITDAEKFKKELKSSEEYDDKILHAKVKLKARLKKLTEVTVRESNKSNLSENATSALKLPKLEIPRFSGNSNFNEFLNCFDSAIGKNESLTKIEKFQYLKSLLSPPAYNVVAGFELNEKNYDSCLELLKERYGRKDFVINSYMSKLLNLEPVRNSSHSKSLRRLYDEIEINIRNLRSLDVTEGSYGHLLNPILFKLLPQDLVLEFQRKRNKDKTCEVSDILAFLRNEVESREICEAISSPKSPETKRIFPQTYQKSFSKSKNIPTASTLQTQIKTPCLFCESENCRSTENCNVLDIGQKINKLKSEGRCWNCFKRNHTSRYCKSGITCRICSSKFHHESLCRKNIKLNASTNTSNRNVENISVSHNTVDFKGKAFLQTCSIYASSDKRSVLTNAILDSASHKSFVSLNLVKTLNLKIIRYEELAIYSFGQTTALKKRYPVVSLELQSRHNSLNTYVLEAFAIEFISNLSLNIPDVKTLRELKKSNFQLADSFQSEVPVNILIGAESFWDIVYDEKVKVTENIWLINSLFGWLLGGVGKRNDFDDGCENVCLVMDSPSILFDLSKFWEVEEFPNEARNISEKDEQLIRNFENNLQFNGQRYVCKLMWKDNMGPPVELDSNYEVAERRYNSLTNKLNRNPEISDQYKQIVKEQLESDIVGKCVNEDKNSGYYMPHRAVIRDDKITSQVRIVFDCSSKANEGKKSLNDSLETGVNLYTNLLDVILKFRENQVAFCGDLEKAFLMIEIAEEDRKYLKFLWFPDGTGNQSQTLQLNRLPFGLTTSPFALACVLKFHIKKFRDKHPECYEMLNSLFVDDLYYGAKTAEEGFQLTSTAIDILRSAGFNLRKLRTNCVELNKLWIENGYGENTDNGKETGFLGLNWNPVEDIINLNLKEVRNSLETGIANDITKRYVLRIISQIFDPCGFISPFVITVKILMQELWERGLKWDEQLPVDLAQKWKNWCSELVQINNLTLNRKLFINSEISEISLHIFSDASPRAYGTVAYFRYVTEKGIKVSFIIAKSKVAPLKSLSLARLELMAALTAARLSKYLKDVFPALTKETYLWTDSQIVLHWLKGSSKTWKPFVANRISQVQSLTPPILWNHCKGKENPADLTTRGESSKKFLKNSLWWNGPEWLSQPVQSWPLQSVPNHSEEVSDEEILSELRKTATINTTIATTDSDMRINVENFSSLGRLLRVTAWVKRFVNNSRRVTQKLTGPLCAAELHDSLYFWIKRTQMKHFGPEMQTLLSKNTIDKSSKIFNLNPELDDKSLLQLKGRLQHSDETLRAKHPLLLPVNDHFVKLLILDSHVKMGHLSVDSTLTQLREHYWIIKGRQFVKKVINDCLVCRRYKVKPGTQIIAPLPPDRILEQSPFNVSGVDFAGPFYINDSNNSKSYLIIFTCAVVRAIHLELVHNMSTESFLLALRRFISRRGLCSTIYSDNAKSFKNADRELKKWWNCINNPEVKELFASKGIVWKFIVERSPWWGGFWERQIRTIKSCLKKIVGKSSLSFKELETIFFEIEAIINSRPITYLYNELSEPSPLTPSHFLVGKRLTSLPVIQPKIEELNVNKNSLTKKFKYQQTLINHFWNRWRKEYLLNLRSAYVCAQPGKINSFKVNDIVLINDERYPRNMWMMGKILELCPGRDGKVRSLLIKTPKGNIKRSVQLVSNLEINP